MSTTGRLPRNDESVTSELPSRVFSRKSGAISPGRSEPARARIHMVSNGASIIAAMGNFAMNAANSPGGLVIWWYIAPEKQSHAPRITKKIFLTIRSIRTFGIDYPLRRRHAIVSLG
jgi:hypothetical protein